MSELVSSVTRKVFDNFFFTVEGKLEMSMKKTAVLSIEVETKSLTLAEWKRASTIR